MYERTGSVLATGVTFGLYNVPRLVLSPVAGVLADRWDRRRALIAADLCSAAILLPLLLVAAPGWLPVVYAVVLAQACVVFLVGPAGEALVPLVVAEGHLVPANALNTVTGGLTRLVGPSLGGALLGYAGFPVVVLVDAVSFLASAALIALVAVQPRPAAAAAPGGASPQGQPRPPAAAIWTDLVQWLRLIAGARRLRVLLCADGLVMVGYGAVTVLLVVFVRDVLAGGALAYGWLATAQGVGTLAGSALCGQAGNAVRPARLFPLSLGLAGLALLGTFNAPTLPLALPAMLLAGAGIVGWGVSGRTLLQTAAPNEYLGRVLGAFATSNGLLILVGMGAASAMAGPVGVVPTLSIAAALYLAAGVLASPWLQAAEAPAMEHQAAAPTA